MTNRNVTRALTAGLLTLGVAAGASVVARAQDYNTEPKGHFTLVGCFLRIADPTEHDGDMVYVLANPKPGPATSVPDANCSADAADPILELTDVHERYLDKVAPGRWVEISGELERPRTAGHLREFDVKAYREVPVERTVTRIVREPAPAVLAKAAPAPAPAASVPEQVASIEKLPKTASPLPLIALLGAIALSGGFALTLLDRPRRRAHR